MSNNIYADSACMVPLLTLHQARPVTTVGPVQLSDLNHTVKTLHGKVTVMCITNPVQFTDGVEID